MNYPVARDVKVFVPAKDFALSLRFYKALGWTCNWHDDSGLAEIELAGARLYLQDYYIEQWANNFMIYVVVDDARQWYEHISSALAEGAFPGARVNPPKEESYGALVTYAWDPCGVLLHFAQRHSR